MMSVAIPRGLAQTVRSGNLFSKRDPAVLDAPEPGRVSGSPRFAGLKRGAAVTEMPLRRDYSYAGADGGRFDPEDDFKGRARRPGVRLSFHGSLIPKTLWGLASPPAPRFFCSPGPPSQAVSGYAATSCTIRISSSPPPSPSRSQATATSPARNCSASSAKTSTATSSPSRWTPAAPNSKASPGSSTPP